MQSVKAPKKIMLLREDLRAPCHKSEARQGVQSSKSNMIFITAFNILIMHANAVKLSIQTFFSELFIPKIL